MLAECVSAAVEPGLGQDLCQPDFFLRGRMLEQMDEHQGALTFLDVTIELLAVLGRLTDQIQQIVLNLKGGAGEKTESRE